VTTGLFAQLIINGFALGMLYVLIVLGLDIILRGTKILNFAHGQIYMLGAYTFFVTYGILKQRFVVALILSALAMAILGALCYVLLFNFLQKRIFSGATLSYRLLMSAMASVGLMMILQQSTLLGFGTAERGVPSTFPQMLSIGNVSLPVERLVIILLSLLICGCLYFLFFKTKLGKSIRAVAIDAEAASLMGINTFRVYLLSFVVGCALAGAAGGIVASSFSVTPTMGHSIIFMAFLVMVVGGIGSYKGAILGGILVGLVLSFGYQFFGSISNVLLFICILIVLIFRPGGILGEVLD
jgi:branched-chain amino acid transport system permease protein